jgi:hypothetical protein
MGDGMCTLRINFSNGDRAFYSSKEATTGTGPAAGGHTGLGGASSQLQVLPDGSMMNQLNVTTNLGTQAIGKVVFSDTAAGHTYVIAFMM